MAAAQAPRREAHFPLTLRCTSLDEALDDSRLDDAILQVMSRALDRAAGVIHAADGIELGGVELGELAANQERAAELQARVEAVLAKLAQALPVAPPVAPVRAPLPSEPFDPDRYDPASGGYEIPSYQGGKKVFIAKRSDEPFAVLLRELNANIAAISDLLDQLDAVGDSTPERGQAAETLLDQKIRFSDEHLEVALIADVLAGRIKADTITGAMRDRLDARVRTFYRPKRPYPDPQLLQRRIGMLQTGRINTAIIAERCARFDRLAMRSDKGSFIRRGFFLVTAAYLEAGFMPLEAGIERIAFLDTFYRDPETVAGYAVSQWTWTLLPDFWKSLVASSAGTGKAALPQDISQANAPPPQEYGSKGSFEYTHAWTTDRLLALNGLVERFGHDFPLAASEITAIPTAADAASMAATVLHIAVDIPILALWEPLGELDRMLVRHPQAGTALIGHDDRPDWLKQLNDLRTAFAREIGVTKHADGIETQVEAWEKCVTQLIKDIVADIRTREIIAAAVEQIPFLFVGGAIASGVAEFLEAAWGASRWMQIIAEGAVLTAFNVIVSIPSQQKITVGGVALQFALNVGFAGLGAALGGIASDIGQGLSGLRRALVNLSGVAVSLTALSAIQAGLSGVERDAKAAGGDTDFTTVFTCDLALNALGLLFGRAYKSAGERLPSGIDRTDTAAIAKVLNISEAAARVWQHYADRGQALTDRAQALGDAYRAGKLTPEAFEDWRKDALGLIDEMLPVVPEIAPFIEGAPPADVMRAGLQKMRSAIATADPTGRGARYASPETTQGLVRVGDSETYVFDPNAPAAQRALIRTLADALRKRGWQIESLPDGGFRAQLGTEPPITILPAGPQVRGLLPAASLDTVVGGEPQASAGLEAIRGATKFPGLEARVATATARLGRDRTIRFLRVMRLLGPTDDAAWSGLSRYLDEGGDLDALTRALTRRDAKEFQAEVQGHARRLLTRVGDPSQPWDASAVRGLAALYRLVPRLSFERIEDLVANLEPAQLAGTLQSIDVLDRRAVGARQIIGQLAAESVGPTSIRQRGAIAVLQNALAVAEKFPGTTIGFEVATPDAQTAFERFQDIVVYEDVTDPAGGGRTTRRAIFRLEIKEVQASSIDARVRRELVKDIILDYDDRVSYGGTSARPPYAAFGWRLAKAPLLEAAMRRANTTNPQDPAIDGALRDVVRDRLKAAFDNPMLKSRVPAAELARYRAEFDRGLAFVEFF